MKSREQLKEYRDMGVEQLTDKLRSTEEELLKLRFRLASGQLEQTAQIRTLRTSIARMRTIVAEKMDAQVSGLA